MAAPISGAVRVAAAASRFSNAAIDRRAAAAVAAVMQKVVQPAMTTTTAGIAASRFGHAASRFGHAAGRFGHAAGRLGSAAGRLAATGHVPAETEGPSVLTEPCDRAGDQQQREQNLGFHSGGSPKGSRMVGVTAGGQPVGRHQRCYFQQSSNAAACVSWASCVRFLRNATKTALVAIGAMASCVSMPDCGPQCLLWLPSGRDGPQGRYNRDGSSGPCARQFRCRPPKIQVTRDVTTNAGHEGRDYRDPSPPPCVTFVHSRCRRVDGGVTKPNASSSP